MRKRTNITNKALLQGPNVYSCLDDPCVCKKMKRSEWIWGICSGWLPQFLQSCKVVLMPAICRPAFDSAPKGGLSIYSWSSICPNEIVSQASLNWLRYNGVFQTLPSICWHVSKGFAEMWAGSPSSGAFDPQVAAATSLAVRAKMRLHTFLACKVC